MPQTGLRGWMLRLHRRRLADGVYFGQATGILYRVHEPRWYQLSRWRQWWSASHKVLLDMGQPGEPFMVRALPDDKLIQLLRVPSAAAKRL